MARRDLLVAAGVLRDKFGRVLLVGNDWQGLGRVRHTLPGGVVEPGETLLEALYREIAEETGLKLTGIKQMAYTVHIEDERRGERAIAVAFEATWEGLLNPSDPDGFIVEARFTLTRRWSCWNPRCASRCMTTCEPASQAASTLSKRLGRARRATGAPFGPSSR